MTSFVSGVTFIANFLQCALGEANANQGPTDTHSGVPSGEGISLTGPMQMAIIEQFGSFAQRPDNKANIARLNQLEGFLF